jgi:hypothetical protein
MLIIIIIIIIIKIKAGCEPYFKQNWKKSGLEHITFLINRGIQKRVPK